MKRTSAVCLLIVAVACSRKGATERAAPVAAGDASVATVESRAPVDAVAAVSADAAPAETANSKQPANLPPPHAKQPGDEGRGVELVPVDVGDAQTQKRRPADDLNAQLDAAKPTPSVGGGSGRIIVSRHRALDETSLSSGRVVTEFLRRALPGVKRCYGKLLANDPRAHGEMKLQFAVSETGSLVDASAVSWNNELSSCVRDLMPKWYFPVPQANGNPTRPRFELALDMKSD